MNFCTCCWLEGSISDGQVGQWWSSMARRLSFLSLESTFKCLAQKALLRKTGKSRCWFSTKVLQSEHILSRWDLATKTLDADVQGFWSSREPESHICHWKCEEHNQIITKLCLEPPVTTVLSQKDGRSGSFGLWLQGFDFRRWFFWLLLRFSVPSIFFIPCFLIWKNFCRNGPSTSSPQLRTLLCGLVW